MVAISNSQFVVAGHFLVAWGISRLSGPPMTSQLANVNAKAQAVLNRNHDRLGAFH